MDIDRILKKILEIDDLVSKKHYHSNKSIIDTITQALINNWNSAYTHISDTVKHITSTERTNWNDADSKKHTHSNKSILDTISQTNLNTWNDKYSKNEVDNKINQVIISLDWKESVATYNDLATTYPNAEDGWTANTKDTDITYRYNGSAWIAISANSMPLATSSVDGKMSKSDKSKLDGVANNANNYTHPSTHPATMIVEDTTHRFTTDTEKSSWNDANSKKHTHSNWSILENITQNLLDSWSDAYTHVSDTVRHITSTERTNWNTAYTNNHTHNNKTILDIITQTLIDNWNAAYTHISDSVKHITSTERTLWNTVSDKLPIVTISVATDFDTLTSNALYYINASGSANCPFSGWGTLFSSNKGTRYQIAIPDNATVMYRRTYNSSNSTWGEWTNMISKGAVGLGSVDNTSDLNKPISTAAQTALNGKANSSHTHTKANITDFPTKLSQFTNDSGFITQADVDTSQNHTHSNKSVLDKITQVLLDNWNSAYSHISDTIKHITSDERSLWNTVSNKLDKSGGTVTGAITVSSDSEISWNRNTDYAKIRFQNTGDSDIDSYMEFKTGDNGNEYFKFNQVNGSTTTELMTIKSDQLRFKGNNVYHTGNKPSASDIGLGNVDNTSDLNKPISNAVQTALNGKANSSHTHDDRYYTESEINTKLDEKSDITHKHNYAGSSSAGGPANSAVKLATARKINGVNFDGISDITIEDSTKLPLVGGTVTGRTLFNQGISINNANGGAGTAGYMYLAQIKISASYQNQPITFDIRQRERYGKLIIKFNSQNTSDPTLHYINKIGNIFAYIVKSTTSTWDIYIQKSEAYDSIDIVGFSKGDYMNSTSVTWQSSTATSLPTGYIEATIATIDIWSTKATQDSDGKQINTTYVKKGMTWNDLEGV